MDLVFNEILEKLEEIHKDFPDLRFGLVVQSSIDLVKNKHNVNLHDYSSKDILKVLTEFRENMERNKKFPGKIKKIFLSKEIKDKVNDKEIEDVKQIGGREK